MAKEVLRKVELIPTICSHPGCTSKALRFLNWHLCLCLEHSRSISSRMPSEKFEILLEEFSQGLFDIKTLRGCITWPFSLNRLPLGLSKLAGSGEGVPFQNCGNRLCCAPWHLGWRDKEVLSIEKIDEAIQQGLNRGLKPLEIAKSLSLAVEIIHWRIEQSKIKPAIRRRRTFVESPKRKSYLDKLFGVAEQ